jgi:hypothetical protein
MRSSTSSSEIHDFKSLIKKKGLKGLFQELINAYKTSNGGEEIGESDIIEATKVISDPNSTEKERKKAEMIMAVVRRIAISRDNLLNFLIFLEKDYNLSFPLKKTKKTAEYEKAKKELRNSNVCNEHLASGLLNMLNDIIGGLEA